MYNPKSDTLGHLLLAGLLLLFAACSGGSGSNKAPELPPPVSYTYQAPPDIGDTWAVAAASTEGVSVALLEGMMNAILGGEYPIVDSIAVAYNGRLILHETTRTQLTEADQWVGNTDPALHALFSVSKSIASIVVGIGIDQGIINNVDVPYLSLFTYPNYENWDERKNDMTLHDVLTMRLGLAWNEFDPPYSDPNNQMLTFYDSHVDFAKGLLDLPLAADPGSVFAYNTVAAVSLGQAIENTAPISLVDFGSTYLLAPLGITNAEFFATPSGLPDLGRGLYFTARDVLKFGQLYLDEGQWNQAQVVSAAWVAASTQAYTQLSWSDPGQMDWQLAGYGYQWWTGYFEFAGRQIETFAARGYGQQWLMVVPELKLVVAVNSHAWEERDDQTNQVFSLIKRFILPALP